MSTVKNEINHNKELSMRLNKVLGFVILAAIGCAVFAADQGQKYVSPTKDGIGIFKNETRQLYEQPVTTVGPQDRLVVIENGRSCYKVKSPGGTVGWIEKSACVATGKSKTFIFDNAEVIGYLDNPTPVYIMDADDPNADPINLDRSFKDALRENVDRETIERETQ
jgi:hypothetical protein